MPGCRRKWKRYQSPAATTEDLRIPAGPLVAPRLPDDRVQTCVTRRDGGLKVQDLAQEARRSREDFDPAFGRAVHLVDLSG
jgi:hypothetical protein